VQCACPTVSITGPSGVTQPGSTMTFTANATGGSQDTPLTYNWTVDQNATIESGQGSPSITVRVPDTMSGGTITATLNLGGTQVSCSCQTTFTESAPVDVKPTSREIDQFGPLSNDDVKARVQNFYTELANNPNAQGYIITYGTPAQIAARRRQVTNAITFLKLDPSRVTFVDGGDKGTGVETHFWIVPPGATPPQP